MRAICKAVAGAGIVLVILGVASFGSPSMLLPIAMIVSGAVMIGASAGAESKWTGRRST